MVASNYKRRYEICYDPSEPDHIGEDFQVTVLDHNQKIPPPSLPSSLSAGKEDGRLGRASETAVDPEKERKACREQQETLSEGKDLDHEHHEERRPLETNQEKKKQESFLSSEMTSRDLKKDNSSDTRTRRLSGALLSEGEKRERHSSSSSYPPAEGVEDVMKTPKVFPVLDPTHAHQQILGGGRGGRGDAKKDDGERDEQSHPSSSPSSLLFSSTAGGGGGSLIFIVSVVLP